MKLALGTVQFGVDYGISNQDGQTPQQQVKDILQYASEHNIDLLDTAAAYGEAESVLGKCNGHQFKLVSKLPPIELNHGTALEFAEAALNKSLDDLNTTSIYGYLLHRADDLANYPELLDWLKTQKQQGIIDKIGVSVYSPEQALTIINTHQIELMQIPLNLFDQRFITSGALDILKNHNVEVHVRSVFLQGLLLQQEKHRNAYFEPLNPHFELLNSLTQKHHVSTLALALNFVYQLEQVDQVVVGVNNKAQLTSIIESLDSDLPEIDWQRLSCDNLAFIDPSRWPV